MDTGTSSGVLNGSEGGERRGCGKAVGNIVSDRGREKSWSLGHGGAQGPPRGKVQGGEVDGAGKKGSGSREVET